MRRDARGQGDGLVEHGALFAHLHSQAEVDQLAAPTQSEVSSTLAARCHPIRAGNRTLLAASGGTPSSVNGTRRRAPASTRTRLQ